MKDIYIKANDLGDLLDYLPNQDLFSLEEILGAFEELLYEYKDLEEQFEDYKEDVEETMQPRDHWTANEMAEYYSNN